MAARFRDDPVKQYVFTHGRDEHSHLAKRNGTHCIIIHVTEIYRPEPLYVVRFVSDGIEVSVFEGELEPI